MKSKHEGSAVIQPCFEKVAVKMAPKLIVVGAPANGTGEQCKLIKQRYGVIHLSMGDVLQAAVAAGIDVGNRAKEYMDAGKLVPDEVIIEAVKERLKKPDCVESGWLLDGFPRTSAQAKALADVGVTADCFIFLYVPDDVLVERVVARRTDPVSGKIHHATFNPPDDEDILARLTQRSDDSSEEVKVRLEQYHSYVAAVKGSFAYNFVEVDGTKKPEYVSEMIIKSIDALIGASRSLQHPSTVAPNKKHNQLIKKITPKQKDVTLERVYEGSPVISRHHNRDDKRCSMKEFTNKRREVLMLNLSIDAHQEELDKLHKAYQEREKRFQRKEKDLAENMRAFDCLLREVDQRQTQTAKNLEEQFPVRRGKEIEAKDLSEQVFIVESMLRQLATTIENSSTTIDH
jgi:adenylate kinase